MSKEKTGYQKKIADIRYRITRTLPDEEKIALARAAMTGAVTHGILAKIDPVSLENPPKRVDSAFRRDAPPAEYACAPDDAGRGSSAVGDDRRRGRLSTAGACP